MNSKRGMENSLVICPTVDIRRAFVAVLIDRTDAEKIIVLGHFLSGVSRYVAYR